MIRSKPLTKMFKANGIPERDNIIAMVEAARALANEADAVLAEDPPDITMASSLLQRIISLNPPAMSTGQNVED